MNYADKGYCILKDDFTKDQFIDAVLKNNPENIVKDLVNTLEDKLLETTKKRGYLANVSAVIDLSERDADVRDVVRKSAKKIIKIFEKRGFTIHEGQNDRSIEFTFIFCHKMDLLVAKNIDENKEGEK